MPDSRKTVKPAAPSRPTPAELIAEARPAPGQEPYAAWMPGHIRNRLIVDYLRGSLQYSDAEIAEVLDMADN